MSKLILMVDDSEDDLRIMTALLRRSGIANPIHSVSDGSQAIAYLKREGVYADAQKYPSVAILILDLRMPQVDGFQVLEWLKERKDSNPMLVIVLSAMVGVAELLRAYQLGANTFLAKPCHPSEIANLIKAYPEHWIVLPAQAQSSGYSLNQ